MSLSLAELPTLPDDLGGIVEQALGSGEQLSLAKAESLLPTRSSECLAEELSRVQCPAALKGTFFI